MTVFDFSNYKEFAVEKIQSMPKRGYGQFQKMAKYLSIGSVNISQIFRGDRNLTIEQACEVADFFSLPPIEAKYFVCLVEHERASSQKLKTLIQDRLSELRAKSENLKHRLHQDLELSEQTKALFYSQWFYSGIRLITSIEGFGSPEVIAKHFNLPISTVHHVLEFLGRNGLCEENKGIFQMGPASTHLESSHPLVSRHHQNWRIKALENLDSPGSHGFNLTMPCSLSDAALKLIRKKLFETTESITKIIDSAPSEKLACINIDLFSI